MKPGYEQIRNDREINLLIEQGNRNLKVLGYTEHSRKHAVKVAETAGRILKELGIGDDRWRWQKLQAICMISEIP